jgi:hypothetical protein
VGHDRTIGVVGRDLGPDEHGLDAPADRVGVEGPGDDLVVGGDPVVGKEDVELGVPHHDEQGDRTLAQAKAGDCLEQGSRIVAGVENGQPDRQLGLEDRSQVGRRALR